MSLNLIMGARNEASNTREENDFYATHPDATRLFFEKLQADKVDRSLYVWEPACGQGHMSEVLEDYYPFVQSSDLVDRGYGSVRDFLKDEGDFCGDIVTNPPFKNATEFCYKAISLLKDGCKAMMFVKIQFLESVKRKKLFDTFPPKYVYVYSQRQQCSQNGDFENLKAKTLCYCWVIWEKDYKGPTELRWI